MAKLKRKFLVEEHPNCINVWTDNPASVIVEIKRIEGVNTAYLANVFVEIKRIEGINTARYDGNPVSVYVDPRYSQKEIADEIKELLKVEVPDVFKEIT